MKNILLNTPLVHIVKMRTTFVLGIVMLIFSSCTDNSSTEKENNALAVTETKFKVWGNCEMCKETIEKSLKVPGVSSSNWNPDTKEIVVKFDSTEINADEIQKKIAASGYDTEKFKGDETAYAGLPECCQYERKP